jgi:hypothetical protein
MKASWDGSSPKLGGLALFQHIIDIFTLLIYNRRASLDPWPEAQKIPTLCTSKRVPPSKGFWRPWPEIHRISRPQINTKRVVRFILKIKFLGQNLLKFVKTNFIVEQIKTMKFGTLSPWKKAGPGTGMGIKDRWEKKKIYVSYTISLDFLLGPRTGQDWPGPTRTHLRLTRTDRDWPGLITEIPCELFWRENLCDIFWRGVKNQMVTWRK